jgi:drug/metabolite transporter (DMT)-like permease
VVATKLTTAANAVLLQYTAPVYVAFLGAWFLGEHTRWFDWFTIVLVMGGMALFFLDTLTPGNLLGNVCAILSGIGFAFFVLFMRRQKNESPIETVILGNFFTGLIGIPFMFESMPGPMSWLGLLFLGVVQLGISYALYSEAIRHVSALEAILIPGIEPILNPIWVFHARQTWEAGPVRACGIDFVTSAALIRPAKGCVIYCHHTRHFYFLGNPRGGRPPMNE